MSKKACKSSQVSKAGKTLSTSKSKAAKSKAGTTLAKHNNKHH